MQRTSRGGFPQLTTLEAATFIQDWVAPRRDRPDEIQLGRPSVEDEELSKLLATAPTYIGLERVIRYCLVRFAELHELFLYEQDCSSEADGQ